MMTTLGTTLPEVVVMSVAMVPLDCQRLECLEGKKAEKERRRRTGVELRVEENQSDEELN
jgi:hypothetical protein